VAFDSQRDKDYFCDQFRYLIGLSKTGGYRRSDWRIINDLVQECGGRPLYHYSSMNEPTSSVLEDKTQDITTQLSTKQECSVHLKSTKLDKVEDRNTKGNGSAYSSSKGLTIPVMKREIPKDWDVGLEGVNSEVLSQRTEQSIEEDWDAGFNECYIQTRKPKKTVRRPKSILPKKRQSVAEILAEFDREEAKREAAGL